MFYWQRKLCVTEIGLTKKHNHDCNIWLGRYNYLSIYLLRIFIYFRFDFHIILHNTYVRHRNYSTMHKTEFQ